MPMTLGRFTVGKSAPPAPWNVHPVHCNINFSRKSFVDLKAIRWSFSKVPWYLSVLRIKPPWPPRVKIVSSLSSHKLRLTRYHFFEHKHAMYGSNPLAVVSQPDFVDSPMEGCLIFVKIITHTQRLDRFYLRACIHTVIWTVISVSTASTKAGRGLIDAYVAAHLKTAYPSKR